MLLVGLFAPVQSGGEAYIIFIPIVIIGWVYAFVYLFYFPYYLLRYKIYDSTVKLGAFVFSTIVVVILAMVLIVFSKLS